MARSCILRLPLPIHPIPNSGLLKKAASGVLSIFPCSRTEGTLRAQKRLRPCWTTFFEQARNPWSHKYSHLNNFQSLFLVDLPLLLFSDACCSALGSDALCIRRALFERSELVRSSSTRPSHPIWPNWASMALSTFAETKVDRLPGRNPAITMD